VAALVAAVVVAFVIGMEGDDGKNDANDGTQSSSGPGTDAPTSPSSTPEKPTEQGMRDFIDDYIATASSDPAAAFDMLTPAFQDESNGLSGYEEFWGDVRSAKILDVSADPETLEVSYTYRYNRPGDGPVEDDVVLRLTFEDGTYLIAQEL
jgi:hypothetical protein